GGGGGRGPPSRLRRMAPARGDASPRAALHRAEPPRSLARVVQVPPGWLRFRLGGRRLAPRRVLHEPGPRRLPLPRDRRQRGRRLEPDGREPRVLRRAPAGRARLVPSPRLVRLWLVALRPRPPTGLARTRPRARAGRVGGRAHGQAAAGQRG